MTNQPVHPPPGSACASFASLLPVMSEGSLEADKLARLQQHLETCMYCQAQRRSYEQLDTELFRQFGPASVPQLSLADILQGFQDELPEAVPVAATSGGERSENHAGILDDHMLSSSERLSAHLRTPPPERRGRMKYLTLGTRWAAIHRLSALAAVLLLTVLVGSLTVGLVLVRHDKNTGGPQPATAIPPTTIPTQLPPAVYLTALFGPTVGSAGSSSVYKLDSQTGTVLWNYHTNRFIGDAPVVAEGVVAFSTQDGLVMGLDASTGKVRWSDNVDGGTSSNVQMTLANGVLLFPSESGHGPLYALNPTNGPVVWHAQIVPGATDAAHTGLYTVSAADGIVYGMATLAKFPSGVLYAFDTNEKRVIWQTPLTIPGQYLTEPLPPESDQGRVYVTSSEASQHSGTERLESYAYAYNAQTGEQLWQSQPLQAIWAGSTVAGNVVYVRGVQDDGVYALNATTGETIWHHAFSGSSADVFQPPVVADGVIYLGQPQLMALNASDGSLRWQQTLSYPVIGAFALSGGVLYALDDSGVVAAVQASDGVSLWRIQLHSTPDFTVGAVVIAP